MSTPLVSVIVPVYNGKEYLAECVDSLLGQTYTNREIILVDDGSTDTSGAICDRYAAEHADVRVVHKPNGGLSDARNAGLDIAVGEYICFADADDVAYKDMIATLVDTALRTHCDIVQGATIFASDIAQALARKSCEPDISVYEPGDAIADAMYQKVLLNSACGKLYARKLWSTLRFRKGTMYEDLDIFYQVMNLAKGVAVTTVPVYIYRQHDESFIHKFTSSRLDVLDVTDRMLQWVLANRPELEDAARTRRLSAHVNILGLMAAEDLKMPDVRRRCLQVLKSDGVRSRRNPGTKKVLRTAMWIYRLSGAHMLELVLKHGYHFVNKRNIQISK